MPTVTCRTYADASRLTGLPVLESTQTRVLSATARDAQIGTPHDLSLCYLSQAHKRAKDDSDAWAFFFRDSAVLESEATRGLLAGNKGAKHLDGTKVQEGDRVLVRFSLPKKTRDAIKKFDETGEGGTGDYELHPVPRTKTRKARNARSKELSAGRAAGTIPPAKTKATGVPRLRTVRSTTITVELHN